MGLPCPKKIVGSISGALILMSLTRTFGCKKLLGAYLLCKADLLHEVQVVPEEGFGDHFSVLPLADRHHVDLERLSGRRYGLPIWSRHRFRERSRHNPGHTSPLVGAELDGMRNNLCVGSENELRLKFIDMVL